MGRFHRKSAILIPSLLLLGAIVMLAQDVTFQTGATLVRLLVTVKDNKGALIGSLEKGDFTVFDSGVPQQVAVFEHHTAYPLSISVLLDISGSTARNLDYELASVEKFLNALLRQGNPEDAAALYGFNDDVTLLTSFTRRIGRLRDSLGRMRASSGTSLYDAVYLAAGTLDGREGRHVIVVVSDGGDTTSSKEFRDALEAAQSAETSIYPILVVPVSGDSGRNLGGERALDRLASETGGRMFTPVIGAQLDAAFTEILRDLRTQYLLGYYPQKLPRDTPRFHPVRVTLKREDLRASTRSGYYEDAAAK